MGFVVMKTDNESAMGTGLRERRNPGRICGEEIPASALAMSVREFAETVWLPNLSGAEAGVKLSERIFARHIAPFFKGARVASLNGAIIDAWNYAT